jgi:hypothetical protein
MDIPDHQRESRPTRLVALLGIVAAIAVSAWLAFAVLDSKSEVTVAQVASRRSRTRRNWSLWGRYFTNPSGSSHVVVLPHEPLKLRDRRISIGREGSTSRALAFELLGRAGLQFRPNFCGPLAVSPCLYALFRLFSIARTLDAASVCC